MHVLNYVVLFDSFQVHSYYNFRPETAYLSVAYLDRFLCNYNLTVIHFIYSFPNDLFDIVLMSVLADSEYVFFFFSKETSGPCSCWRWDAYL